jgi:hypothetical protein
LYLARHECGTKNCREKGIEYARRLLGHTNISTTQRYLHLDDRELADAQDLNDGRRSPIHSDKSQLPLPSPAGLRLRNYCGPTQVLRQHDGWRLTVSFLQMLAASRPCR